MSDPPTNIRALQADQILEVTWPEGRVDRFPYRLLRSECPCAACRNEWTGERMLDPDSIRPDLKLTAWIISAPTRSSSPGTTAIRRASSPGKHCGRIAEPARARREGERPVAASVDRSLLTVAVPTCNGAAHLAEALQSILSQDRCRLRADRLRRSIRRRYARGGSRGGRRSSADRGQYRAPGPGRQLEPLRGARTDTSGRRFSTRTT